VRDLVLTLDVVLVEVGDRVPVVEPHEGPGGGFEAWVEEFDLSGSSGVGEEGVDDGADLQRVEEVTQKREDVYIG
jgi:hypothetical protein